jgi:hypothetical protein
VAKLDHILGLLGSEHAGERATAALKADAFLKKHKLSWRDLIEGRIVQGPRRSEVGIDYLEAAESRLRQMKAHNEALEKQVSRLKAQLEALKEEAR